MALLRHAPSPEQSAAEGSRLSAGELGLPLYELAYPLLRTRVSNGVRQVFVSCPWQPSALAPRSPRNFYSPRYLDVFREAQARQERAMLVAGSNAIPGATSKPRAATSPATARQAKRVAA